MLQIDDLMIDLIGKKNVDLNAGDLLFSEGDTADSAFVVKSGLLEVTRKGNGAEVVIGTCGPGTIVGEMALIDEKPRSATIRALRPSELAIIPRAEFDLALRNADPTIRGILERFTTIIRAQTDRAVQVTVGRR